MTASSLRASSHRASSTGGTRSTTWCLARLRHFASSRPKRSLTTTSVEPASLRLATMFAPMNPAPPVTKNILPSPATGLCGNLCPSRRPGAIICRLGLQNAHNRVKNATGQVASTQGNALLCPPRHRGATGTCGAGAMGHEFNQAAAPVVIIPFVWIGDFVRCHSVVKLLRAQNPDRAVDIVGSTLCAPLADYMPGIRRTIVADLPRRRLGVAKQRQLADQLGERNYAQALVMSRKWKAALAPWLAGIPVRTGFAGEFRFGLLNDIRFGERRLPRMIDQMGALALPKEGPLPAEWTLA